MRPPLQVASVVLRKTDIEIQAAPKGPDRPARRWERKLPRSMGISGAPHSPPPTQGSAVTSASTALDLSRPASAPSGTSLGSSVMRLPRKRMGTTLRQGQVHMRCRGRGRDRGEGARQRPGQVHKPCLLLLQPHVHLLSAFSCQRLPAEPQLGQGAGGRGQGAGTGA